MDAPAFRQDTPTFRQWCLCIQAAQTERTLLIQYLVLTAWPPSPMRAALLALWAARWNALTDDQVTLADLEAPC
jgi:hypothetical protein